MNSRKLEISALTAATYDKRLTNCQNQIRIGALYDFAFSDSITDRRHNPGATDLARVAMKSLSLAIVLILAGTVSGCASPFEGSWQEKYPPTGDDGDVFRLDVWTHGNRLCATHQATAHDGMRVDEDEDDDPSVKGIIKGTTASVDYVSRGWEGSGTANMVLQNGKMHWHVTKKTGQSWIPDDAVLTRMRGASGPPGKTLPCDSGKIEVE